MLKIATKLAPVFASLETAYRAGFRNVELYLDAAILADWRTALDLARHYPNAYALHFPNRAELNENMLHGCVELYRELACQALVMHQPMFDRYSDDLLRREPRLRLAIENHRLSPEQFEQWAERSPGLTLDVEHVWMCTYPGAPLDHILGTLADFLSRWGEKLRHVHLPGYWPGCREHRPMYCARDLVFPVLSQLAAHRFEGLIVSEVLTEYQNLAELTMDVLLFAAWRQQQEPPVLA